jgi:DNA polymerase (family 10)
MEATEGSTSATVFSNAEIADRLESLAQLLSAQRENRYKVKAYRRAAAKIRTLSESLHDLVLDEADLTRYAAIGEAIAAAIRVIVLTGTLARLETLRAQTTPELAGISEKQPVLNCLPWEELSVLFRR